MKPKSKPEIIAYLNTMLAEERAFNTQFVIHEAKLESFGFDEDKVEKLYAKQREQIEELVERIVFLGGEPSIETDASAITVGNNIIEVMMNDEAVLYKGIANCTEGIDLCNKNKDFGTAKLLCDFLKNYEEFLFEIEVMLNMKSA